MRTIAACHKVFTENNGLEVNISATIKRRKMINTRTLSQAAAHKPDFSTPGILQTRSIETLLYAYFFCWPRENALQQKFFSFSFLPCVQKTRGCHQALYFHAIKNRRAAEENSPESSKLSSLKR
ncbi:hypothetical protein [Pantoea septica]|uniref:hypothetical protein n=1 Tax=Pantoea septica TaxID=472695 RepID=UPI003CFCDE87